MSGDVACSSDGLVDKDWTGGSLASLGMNFRNLAVQFPRPTLQTSP